MSGFVLVILSGVYLLIIVNTKSVIVQPLIQDTITSATTSILKFGKKQAGYG